MRSTHKHWHTASVEKLRAMWPKYKRDEILKAFPGRTWRSIAQKAHALKLRRHARTRTRVDTKDPLMAALRKVREANGMACTAIGRQIDVSRAYVARCERGQESPSLPKLLRWCAFLGLELTVKTVGQPYAA